MEDPFDDDDDDIDSGSRTPVASMDSKAPILARQPSLVDELLSEIYARFGNGLTSRSFDSSQRASASGSQVKRAIFRFLKEHFKVFISLVSVSISSKNTLVENRVPKSQG